MYKNRGIKNVKKNENLTAHQASLRRLYQCQSKIFSTFLSKIMNSLGGDPTFVILLDHAPTTRPTCPAILKRHNKSKFIVFRKLFG